MVLAIPACPVQPDSLVGHLKPEEPALPQLLARVLDGADEPPVGVTEWMLHPGYRDPNLASCHDAAREQTRARPRTARIAEAPVPTRRALHVDARLARAELSFCRRLRKSSSAAIESAINFLGATGRERNLRES